MVDTEATTAGILAIDIIDLERELAILMIIVIIISSYVICIIICIISGTMAVVDLDGDGYTEIISAGYTAGEVYVFTFNTNL